MQRTLAETDPDIARAIRNETTRQAEGLELIASENFVSSAILEATGSVMTNKYAEGYPGRRYYGGCEFVDIAETIAIERAKKLFGAPWANVQPHSGAQANMAVYFSLLKPGDTVLGPNLSHGGHLTAGSPVNYSGKFYTIVAYGVRKDTERIDLDEVRDLARRHRPKLIIAGGSAFPRAIDFAPFGDIARETGAAFMAEAQGKLSHWPGICFVTRGPGATNASIGLHTAFQDSTPMILFVGQVQRNVRGREAFQEVEFRQMFAPLAKWVAEIDTADRIPEYVLRAFQVAASGRPGPVVLALPEDTLFSEAAVADVPRHHVVRAAPVPADIEKLRQLLADAQRPFVLVGGGGLVGSAVMRVTERSERRVAQLEADRRSLALVLALAAGLAVGCGEEGGGETPPQAMIPSSTEAPPPGDLEEQLIVRFATSFDSVFTTLSGERDLQRNTFSADTTRSRTVLLNGSIALGTRRLGYSQLHTYVLVTAGVNLSGRPALLPADLEAGVRLAPQVGVLDRFADARSFLL